MIRPDAIPVRPAGSYATLTRPLVGALFGPGYALRGTERVELVRLGRVAGSVPVRPGEAPALAIDAIDADRFGAADGLRWQGPAGARHAPTPTPVRSRLALPDGLRRAWNVPAHPVLALGPLALAVPVEAGTAAVAEVERAAWLAAGRPTEARWLPGVSLAAPAPADVDDGVTRVPRRVITETDVRQARLRRRTIRVEPGQVVTPAALSLGREWNVFAG